MKRKIFFVIYLIFQVCILSAQNSIDPSSLGILTNPSNSTAINTTPNKFLKSWNWYQLGAKLDEALSMNAGHDN